MGLAVATAFYQPVRFWSSLIVPTEDWALKGIWNAASERLHGVSRIDLVNGVAPSEVAGILNELLEPVGHAWCDGGPYDPHWLETLYPATRFAPRFELGSDEYSESQSVAPRCRRSTSGIVRSVTGSAQKACWRDRS